MRRSVRENYFKQLIAIFESNSYTGHAATQQKNRQQQKQGFPTAKSTTTSKLEVDPLGEEGKEEKIERKEIKIKNFSKFFANWTI